MRRVLATITLALVLALPCVAQRKTAPLKIEGDTLVVVKTLPCKVIAPTGGSLYAWSFPREVRAVKDTNVLTIQQAPKGMFVVTCTITTVNFDKKSVTQEDLEIEVNYGGVAPPPPPGPGPGPDPNPAPIPVAGFRVLIVYETGTVLPPLQEVVLTSATLRTYLRAKCVDDPTADLDAKGWRIWDKDEDTSGVSKVWADAMKRERKSLPWILVSNGKTGYEGPLPGTVDDTITLLKKYELPATKKESK